MSEKMSKDELFVKYEKLIWFIVNKFKITNNQFYDYDDLFQEACIGMLKAYERYDPEKGEFTSFMFPYVYYYIQRYINNNSSYFSFRKRGRDDKVNIDIIRLDDVCSKFNELTYKELVGGNPDDHTNFELCQCARMFSKDDRSFDIWYRVYILDEKIEIVGKDYGISKQRVKQIIDKINIKLGSTYFKDFAEYKQKQRKGEPA